MLARVVSGGQTGVDVAGLDAALECGLETDGWMPLGFLAEDGPHPDYAQKYRVRQTRTDSYYTRTRLNVAMADATLIVHAGPISGGTRLTMNFCKQKRDGDEWLAVDLDDIRTEEAREQAVIYVARWLRRRQVFILNCAGPRESKCPGIYQRARDFFVSVFHTVPQLVAEIPSE